MPDYSTLFRFVLQLEEQVLDGVLREVVCRSRKARSVGKFGESVRRRARTFTVEPYRQRVHAETVFSAIKRKLSASGPKRSAGPSARLGVLDGTFRY